MARRGNFSQSFLRSKDLLSFSEISHDNEGNNISSYRILEEALACDANGQLIRNKVNIAKILNKYGVLYRMVFNAMNMDQYTYDEVQEALDYLSDYINDFGVSGIIEFHASDKTQNSDHIHFWISSEERLIYNKIAQEMVAMGYSNEEDVYIQKYEDNEKIDEIDYVNDENSTINERFSIKPINQRDINKVDKELNQTKPTLGILSSLHEKYNTLINNINKLFKKTSIDDSIINKNNNLDSFNKKSSIIKDCTLPKNSETDSILSRIDELRKKMN